MEDFHRWFKQEAASIDQIINSIANDKLTEGSKQAAIERSLTAISQLSAEVKDAASSLPAHDLQSYSKSIDSMTKRLQEARTASSSKRKFVFKKNGSSTPAAHRTPTDSSPDVERSLTTTKPQRDESYVGASKSVSQQSPSAPYAGFRLSPLNATHYILASSISDEASMASLENIQRSCVDMSIVKSGEKSFATLMVNNVKESLLLCGTISGSAHITAVNDSTIVIKTQQIRIHDCENIVVYLQCSSRPIIEDCTAVRFAPLPVIFVGLALGKTLCIYLANLCDVQTTEHDKVQVDMWDQVDDFKWLKAEASPNWSVLGSEDDRAIDDGSWREIHSQKSSVNDVEVLLKYAKIQ